MTPAIYVHTPRGGSHLIAAWPSSWTLCNRQVTGRWEYGRETLSGHAATCKACRRAYRALEESE